MSFTRIGSNLAAIRAFNQLRGLNRKFGSRLLRLSSGKRINHVKDDPAGFSLARGLESRRRSLEQALSNVHTARNVLSIAEGGYLAVAGILQTIKEKVVQGADDAYNSDQRAAIQGQIDALVDEIDAIAQETSFQGTKLIDGSFTSKLFQTGGSAGDTFMVSLDSAASSAFNGFVGGGGDPEVVFGANDTLAFDENGSSLAATLTPGTYTRAGLATELQSALNAASVKPGLSYAVTYDGGTGKYTISKAGGGPTVIVLKWTDAASAGLAGLLGFYTNANDSIFNGGGPVPIGVSDYVPTSGTGLSVANASVAATTMTYVDLAISTLNTIAQKVGEYMVRLDSKADTLAVRITNTEATRSRIEDADFAREHMGLTQVQILQQTAFAAFAQANAAPQLVLSIMQ